MRTRLFLSRCFTLLGVLALIALAMGLNSGTASAQTCAQDEFTAAGNSQKLGCTANDVRVAQVTNVRDLNGNPLSKCLQGTTFTFLADFEIVTSSTSSRSNIGLYFASQGQPSALTGTCVDNIISPLHQCPGAAAGIMCGSDNYHELDGAPDTCGDTSSSDSSSVFGTAAEGVTVVVSNFLCEAPAGSTTLQMPNCTTWQVPGKTISCVSPGPSFPYETAAIPGAPSKCNCGVLPLPIQPVTASATAAKSCNTTLSTGANLTSCDAGPEGSTVTYHVAITNSSSFGDIIVDQICDSAYGNVFTANGFTGPSCPAGSVGSITGTTCSALDIALNATATCDFTALQHEIKTVTDTVNVSGHSAINTSSHFGPVTTNSVSVTSEDAPSSATVTKGFVGTEAACATVRYSVDVKNTGTADETLSLSAFNDSAYGDITKVQGSVLGTTCGVAAGLGTLSGSTGAGALPASLAVGGADYTCQFDGQFCSALDNNSCISHSNKVSATLTGDENAGETVTQTGNTLTVKECLTATVTSTTP